MKTFIPILITAAAFSWPAETIVCGADPTGAQPWAEVRAAIQQAQTAAQDATQEAAKQYEAVREQFDQLNLDGFLSELTQASAQLARPAKPGTGGGGFGNLGDGSRWQRRTGGSPGKVLVIRSGDTDPAAQVNLEEDLTVMSRVFDKAIEENGGSDRKRTAMGIDVFFTPNANPNRTLYLDGYGAVFLLKVGFPLLAPPAVKEEAKEKPATDSSWEEAKRELYGQPGDSRLVVTPGEEYDADKVNKLKDALLEAFKSATNIRGLKPDDSITACVFGGGAVAPTKNLPTVQIVPMGAVQSSAYSAEASMISDERTGQAVVTTGSTVAAGRGTVLTIRAKKSDVDAFAKGKLNLDEFRKKVSLSTYYGNSDSPASGATFLKAFGEIPGR